MLLDKVKVMYLYDPPVINKVLGTALSTPVCAYYLCICVFI